MIEDPNMDPYLWLTEPDPRMPNNFSVLTCVHRSGIFSTFMQMYLTWGPSTWALASGCPPLFILILFNVSQHRSLASGSEESFLSLIGFH